MKEPFEFTEKKYGGVDFVFANAGYNGNVVLPLADKSDQEIEDNFRINTIGAIFTLRSAVNAFRKRGGGTIVFSSSIMASVNYKSATALAAKGFGGASFLAYSAAKTAVDAVSRNAGQFAGENIKSFSLQIATYDSEMSRNSAKQVSNAVGSEVPVEAFGANNPIFDTLGNSVHVGEVVLALFDGSSSWQPGQTIVVDNDGTADAAHWTAALDAPLDTDDGLPTKEMAKTMVRSIGGKPYAGQAL